VYSSTGNEAFENRIFAELAKEEEQKNDGFKTREGDLNYSKDTVLEHIDKIEITMPENVVKVRFEIRTYRNMTTDEAGGYIYYDDMELIQLD
jgi:DNA-directed RNA polymerase subunit F